MIVEKKSMDFNFIATIIRSEVLQSYYKFRISNANILVNKYSAHREQRAKTSRYVIPNISNISKIPFSKYK